MNQDFLQETPTEYIPYILREMIREDRRWRKTKPLHSQRSCDDRQRCVVHAPRGRRQR